ncbi:MAG: NINE protein [Corynebacterium sp.]|uniref:TM2 domain-containing protein n=1 Tax=Corynebacterium sp. TaxID=1720 RepID=UPI0026DBA9FE|nr:TM2 domain-containing protein [Corynebacterium sp.]MDO5029944.1 NINE protein [Corynebacterium sp.]
MTNPYGNYDEDGMPIKNPKPWDVPPTPQSYGNPPGYQSGYQQQAYGQPNYQQPNGYQQQAYGQPPVSAGYNPHVNYFSPASGISPKSKVLAALLAFFVGAFGVHNFYLGRTGRGLTQLTLWGGSVMSALILEATIILAPLAVICLMVTSAVGIWAFVEFILLIIGTGSYKYDAQGRILT